MRRKWRTLWCGFVLSLLVLAGAWAASCDDSPAAAAASGAPADSPPATAPSPASPVPRSDFGIPSPPALTPAEQVELIVAAMTLEQKAAQVLIVTFDGRSLTPGTSRLLEEAAPGGLLLLGANIGDMNELRALTASLQEAAAANGAPGLFLAVDQEGGIVRRVTAGVPDLPSARALGSGSSPAVARALALMTGAGLQAQGVNMVFAPVADVVTDPASFLYERSYSGIPRVVSQFVAAVTDGYESAGLVAVVKHFPGHGSTPEDSHYSTPISDHPEHYFRVAHLPPFRAAFAAGAEGVMMGHFIATAFDPVRPVSLSPAVIRGLLRGDLGFAGLVVSDDLEMGGATSSRPDRGERASMAELKAAAVAALEAGCDLLISTGTRERQKALREGIVEAVRSGRLPLRILEEAVLRILTYKQAHGLPLGWEEFPLGTEGSAVTSGGSPTSSAGSPGVSDY